MAATWHTSATLPAQGGRRQPRSGSTPGSWSTPLHSRRAEEEIFYVARRLGLCPCRTGATPRCDAGDCLVHRATRGAHAPRRAGGLDVLVVRRAPSREYAGCRARGVLRSADVGSRPARRSSVGRRGGGRRRRVRRSRPSGRRSHRRRRRPARTGRRTRRARASCRLRADRARTGSAATARTGRAAPLPLGRRGDLRRPRRRGHARALADAAARSSVAERGAAVPIRAAASIARPPGTRVAHMLRAGADGLTYLAYGTRDPNDICYYPRSNKVYFRGAGRDRAARGPRLRRRRSRTE